MGLIELALSKYPSSIALVPKPDGMLRICVNYRRFNGLMIHETYPLPIVDDYFDSLADAQNFMTLDCNSRYSLLPIIQ